jgi:RNA polymerase sigma factor (sigma-70 family)
MRGAQRTSLFSYLRARTAREEARHAADSELLRRFGDQRDEAAFAALVRRHGAMVLGVCRRVLGNVHDAEDAFQATFFVLARKAASVRWQSCIAGWLYHTAHHLAVRARTAAARRRAHEADVRPGVAGDPLEEVTLREFQQVLDEELARLPEKYQAPIVLCCLEGASRDEAAQRLGWSVATIKDRLEQGRERLRKQLARRGVTLGAALASVTLAERTASALPPALANSTGAAAVLLAAGRAPDVALASAQALALARGAMTTMTATRLTGMAGVIVLAGLVGGGGLLAVPARDDKPAAPPSRPAALSVERQRSRAPGMTLLPRAPAPLPRPNQDGRAVNGLQLTLHAPPPDTSMMPDGSNSWTFQLHFVFKNASNKPLKLDMGPGPLLLGTKLEVKGPSARSVRFVASAFQREARAPAAKDFLLLAPGKTWARAVGFPRDALCGGQFYLLEPGKYRLKATYALLRQADSPFAAGSWTGTVVSNELVVTVLPNISDERGFGPVHGLCARLSLPKRPFAVGEAIKPTYVLKNVSKAEVALWHSGFWPNHRIVVRDAAGKEPPLTKEGQERRKAFSPGGKRDKNVAWKVPGGGEDASQGSYDLTRLYDLSRPDRYTVQYIYEEEQPGAWRGRLPSNVVTFVVAGKQ